MSSDDTTLPPIADTAAKPGAQGTGIGTRFATKTVAWGRTHAPAIALFFLVVVIWEAAVILLEVPRFLLPAPTVIAARIVEDRAMLWENLEVTMIAALAGFALGIAVAWALSVVFLYSRILERALFPWAIIIKTIPILAIAPLLTIWLGFGIAPKIAIAAIASFFPILVNTVRGLNAVDRQALELMRLLGASRWETIVHIRLFTSLPYTFAALKISSGIAVIGAIVAEFTGANLGIGTIIVTAGYRQDAAMLFSAIFVSCIATIALFYVVVLAERLLLYWPDAKTEV